MKLHAVFIVSNHLVATPFYPETVLTFYHSCSVLQLCYSSRNNRFREKVDFEDT